MDHESSILTGLKTGDSATWSIAFQLLWPIALRAARHPELVLSLEEAEDAANEALGQVVSQIEKLGTLEQLKALTAAIAYRRAVSLARRKYASKRYQVSPAGSSAPECESGKKSEQVAPSANLSDQDLAELTMVLERLLAELDVATRTLVLAKVVEGASYAELSQAHGLPLGTVCAKVARGLKKLRQILDQSPALLKELQEFLR